MKTRDLARMADSYLQEARDAEEDGAFEDVTRLVGLANAHIRLAEFHTNNGDL
jgi:hypothetical protein